MALVVCTACGVSGAGGSSASPSSAAAASASTAQGAGSATPSRYAVTVLATDEPAAFPGAQSNAGLVNGWGLAATPTSFWWVANNGSGTTSLLDATGSPNPALPFVTVTGAGGAQGVPTGVVAYAGSNFKVPGASGPATARFLFAAEDGTISGWTPGSAATTIAVDHSAQGEVFKGLAYASTPSGDRLYATDFHDGRVEVFDGSFAPLATAGDFKDPRLPAGFAPFGIQVVSGTVIVTFAKQDAAAHDDVQGRGLGVVSAFDADGNFLRRIAGAGKLNAPWGVALAPADFGQQSGRLLVGNFGDGHVIAYRVSFPVTASREDDDEGQEGQFLIGDRTGPLTIDGLWGIAFGNGSKAGPTNALYFAGGPGGEAHGQFGRIDPVAEGKSGASGD